jgi:hypothetical protein
MVDRAAAGKEGRSDLVTARTGTENNPLATIRRIEDSILKTDLNPKRTADATEGTVETLKMIWGWISRMGGQDNRENPPKAD